MTSGSLRLCIFRSLIFFLSPKNLFNFFLSVFLFHQGVNKNVPFTKSYPVSEWSTCWSFWQMLTHSAFSVSLEPQATEREQLAWVWHSWNFLAQNVIAMKNLSSFGSQSTDKVQWVMVLLVQLLGPRWAFGWVDKLQGFLSAVSYSWFESGLFQDFFAKMGF